MVNNYVVTDSPAQGKDSAKEKERKTSGKKKPAKLTTLLMFVKKRGMLCEI